MKTWEERDHHTKRVQRNRIKKWEQPNRGIGKDKHRGMMKKTHFGCGCKICKPWKHYGNNKNWDNNMKHSDRKRSKDGQDN